MPLQRSPKTSRKHDMASRMERYEEIKKMLNNMKKDTYIRKTNSYVQDRLQRLTQWEQEANTEYDKVLQQGELNEEFEQWHQHMTVIIKMARDYIQDCQKAPASTSQEPNKPQASPGEPTPTPQVKRPSDEEATSSRLAWLESDIEDLSRQLRQLKLEMNSKKSKAYLKQMKMNLEEDWQTIKKTQQELRCYDRSLDIKNQISALKSIYYEIMIELEEQISSSQTNIKLTPVQIPSFDGNYERWTTFYDLFNQVINCNGNLSNAEKMQYLKTHLKGEPSRIIQHLLINEANYQTAWKILQERYQNKRLIVNKFIGKLLDMPSQIYESSDHIKLLHDTATECLKGLENLGIETATWGPIVNLIITRKWDNETSKLYEQSLQSPHDVQDHNSLMMFLQSRFQSLESIGKKKHSEWTTPLRTTSSTSGYNNDCKKCKGSHQIWKCPKFLEMSPTDRSKSIKQWKLCINCLQNHDSQPCKMATRCKMCKRFHHSLLHVEDRQNQQVIKQASNVSTKKEQDVLLATAIIKIKANDGTPHLLRALIDPGSQSAFITEEAATLLAFPREKIHAEISGLGDGEAKISRTKITVNVQPRFPSEFQTICEFLVLNKITSVLPKQALSQPEMDGWSNEYLADPTYYMPGPIDILMGASEYTQIIKNGLRKSNGLLAQNTELGWTICGSTARKESPIKTLSLVVRSHEDNQLLKFWETEEVEEDKPLSLDNANCEAFYAETTQRMESGRYVVRIPFKEEPSKLGESRQRAMARYIQLEKRLKKDQQLEQGYKAFLKEYLELGHMKTVTSTSANKYYIPHQPVIKPDSTTTKLRVVFDASCKTSNGNSLNSISHAGPRIQQNLTSILLRWRTNKIAFTADIEKMYRQIVIHEADQSFQTILWRFDSGLPIQEYQLTTVTYGKTSAPYLAIKTLQTLAYAEKERYPKASMITLRDFYVDDILSGTDSVKECLEIQTELIQMLKSAGFNLRKWSSNNQQVLENVPTELRNQESIELNMETTTKSLGLLWHPSEDSIKFKIKVTSKLKFTKREIISEIAKLFDPLGWLSPVILRAKLLIQELWIKELGWDTPVPEDINHRWVTYQNGLKSLESITIPRWIHGTRKNIELHGFADASEKAYGAVIYCRTSQTDGLMKVTLLTAKSKVAPIKGKKTLPRLELCAAVLLTKLMTQTLAALELKNTTEVFTWTDSMIALAWIKGEANRWKTFVANRVAEINRALPSANWNHVRTEENPADMVSRGIDPVQLKDCTLWWQGPKWLCQQITWPEPIIPATSEEETKVCCFRKVEVQEEQATKFSTLNSLVRVTAYCVRFCNNLKKKKKTGPLTVEEMDQALNIHVRQAQALFLSQEVDQLQKGKQITPKSKILPLKPIMDSDKKLVRVGGRLNASALPYSEKHPIIIPKNCWLATLITRDAHGKTMHGGNQQTMAYIKRKFWIIDAKKLVKRCIHDCVRCIRYKGNTLNQIMKQLPAARVNPSHPFSHTGVDYAGPLNIRMSKGRGNKSYKGYIAIFICFVTKAVHIEVVSDMTSDAFLAAFRRFVAIRGCPSDIYSDNGTNFVGAAKLLQSEVKKVQESSQEKINLMGVHWHFNPPLAPHHGGLWEAAVKSMKHHLKRVIGETALTYEELSTLTRQIEGCLNSRPLWPLTNDVNDTEVLTPAHFLIGRPIVTPNITSSTDVTTSHAVRWKLVQKMKRDTWKTWSSEYLHQLQSRYKWKLEQENIKVGDLVLIKHDNIQPGSWPLGKIATVYAAQDGKVRVADVQEANGKQHKRPITRLIPLKINETNKERSDMPSSSPATKNGSTNIVRTMLVFLTLLATANTIRPTPPGLYVEHMGVSTINRGTFQLNMQFNKSNLQHDESNVREAVRQMEQLCKNTTQGSSKLTNCEGLLHHLQEQQQQFIWTKQSIEEHHSTKTKRGILGKFLTTIFGVNDEVYQNIDTLDKNQQELMKTSNHQTKIMLSALRTFNDTDRRIEERLNKLTEAYNNGIAALNDMQYWYQRTDYNRLNIQLFHTYQLTTNYISEIQDKWTKILNIQLHRGHIYDLVAPTHVKEVITKVSGTISSHLEVLQNPIMRITVNTSASDIIIQTYFLIQEVTKFEMIKVTSIPNHNASMIWTMDVLDNTLAINYNTQTYFQLTNTELSTCFKITELELSCSPTMILDIQRNQNCVINELYHRQSEQKCKVTYHQFNKPIWKPLQKRNTWLCITTSPTHISLMCNGIRDDSSINSTSIIQTSPDCTIHTAAGIISARMITTGQVQSTLIKPLDLNTNNTRLEFSQSSIFKSINTSDWESSKSLEILQNAEQEIHAMITKTTWKSVKHHSMLFGSGTIAIIATIIGGMAWWIYRMKSVRSDHQPIPTDEYEMDNSHPRPMFRPIRRPRQNVQSRT